ncbi:MAG: tetratricopeptide repeat protein [Pirellulaceae bacterium]|nr:tetratricopeptide repeat protein [Pirellulaceae bacterium]
MAQSPGENAPAGEVVRYDVGWKALNTMLKSGRSLSGHERNCCFLNTRGGRFANIAAVANLDFDDDGRVVALADWDVDGDLDMWIANRTGPQCRFLRNDQENDYGFVAFRLQGVHCNRDAIGARVEIYLADDPEHPRRMRTLRAGEGYLAQSSKWVHFGLGDRRQIERVVVAWPHGDRETFIGVEANQRYKLVEGRGESELLEQSDRSIVLEPSKVKVPPSTDQSRIVLISPIPVPVLRYTNSKGQPETIASKQGKTRLINLWATWCKPCLHELDAWKKHAEELRSCGLEIVAVNVDEPDANREAQLEEVNAMLDQLQFPFERGFAMPDLSQQFDVLQRSIVRRQKPMPVPTSFLIDGRGNLRVIYKGPVSAQQLIADSRLMDASPEEVVAASVPYPGIWLGTPAGASPNQIAVKLVEGGFIRETEEYLKYLQSTQVKNPRFNRADANILLGAIYFDQNRLEESADAFQQALISDPSHRQSHIELGRVLNRLEKFDLAADHFEKALERRQNDPELRFKLGMARLKSGAPDEAIRQLIQAVELRPSAATYHQIGNIYHAQGQLKDALEHYSKAVEINRDFYPAVNNLAWTLATSSDASLRDGQRAVELAERVCSRPASRDPSNLDTLAAALAEAGQYEDAVATIKEAIRKAKTAGDLNASRSMERRLLLYQEDKPFHAP